MTMVTRWNPFREFDDFFRAGLASANPTAAGALEQASWRPAVDILETDDAFRLLLDIPAVAAQDVKVSVEDNLLTISGEIPSEEASEQVTQHRRERRVGRFSRSFRLPETVDEDAIDASSKDGVLTLTIAKRAQSQPRQIEVKVH